MKGFARLGLLAAVLGLVTVVVALMVSSGVTVSALGDVDLTVEIQVPEHVAPGAEYQIRIAYYNVGTQVAPDINVTAVLPSGTEFITATDRWGEPLPPDTMDGGTLTWDVGSPICYKPLDSCCGHVLITVRVDADLVEGTELTAFASVATSVPDSDMTNNETTAVSVVCDMAASGKQVHARLALPGDVLTYTLTVSRAHEAGGNPWEWVVVTDRVPYSFSHQVRFLGWAGDVTGTLMDGQTLRWEAQVRAGQSLQLKYRLGIENVVTPGTPITNVAMLSWQNENLQLGPVTTVVTLPHGSMALGPYEGGQVHHRYGVTLTVPPGAISDTTQFRIGPIYTGTYPPDPPGGLLFAHRAFEINAYRFGDPVGKFNAPLTITMNYTDTDVAGFKRETLRIWTRSRPGEPWAMIGDQARVMSRTMGFTTTHLSEFALFGEGRYEFYLPLILR